jgi:heat shock protein HtpX
MTVVIILVGIIALVSDIFLRMTLFGGGRKSDSKGGNGIMLVIGIVLIILSPIIAQLIKFAVSRKREYLADASGSLLTRYPEGLANALEKIKNDSTVLKRANNATAHLYISSPFRGTKKFLANSFSTHPPIEDRINKLRGMTR